MNMVEAKEAFITYYPNLPLAVKHAVKFTLENWDEMREIPLENVPINFTVEEALSFLKSLSKLPTDAREEDKDFIEKLNRAVFTLQGDLNVWLSLEDLPHEEWLDVEDYGGDYQVSNYSRIKSFKNHKVIIMHMTYTKDGYFEASLSKNGRKKRTSVHNVVARAFIPNPLNKPQVNHEDANTLNNCIWNLNWMTNQENQLHAIKIGVKRRGCDFPGSKLTEEQVRYMRSHYIPRHPEFGQATLARKFNVSNQTIQDVIHCKSYKNVV